MRITLVHMPWGALDVPSLALGIMREVARRRGHEVEVRYANLDFADWITRRLPFGLRDYQYFSEDSYFQGAGDWVFAGALHGTSRPFAPFAKLLDDAGASAHETALTRELHACAPDWITELVGDIVAGDPEMVGFTSTFQQNCASLAAARLIKRLRPGVRVVLGGANCDGPQGAALHRNFPFVDYVVRGEGEPAFPALLDALSTGDDLSHVPGLCWRDATGAARANDVATRPLAPNEIVAPDYDGFPERLDASAAAGWVAPRLVVEGSRGCWWGEKHHCTFCGLNGTLMEFRSKSPRQFHDEVLALAARHRLLDFVVVDNILDMAYFDSVLAWIAESGYDLRLHFEVKANLRRHHLQRLADAGAVQVQPGVESLNGHVLKLMDKGVTGCQNVRALRDAQSVGVTASWNYLYGFPGETADDYDSVIRQLPRLHHLEPPVGANRIAVERFSPYFNRPELGFSALRPAPMYHQIYELPEHELFDLAYIFACVPQGIGRDRGAALESAVDAWRAAYPDSRLTVHDLDDRLVLVNRREAYPWTVLDLQDPGEVALFRLLAQPHKPAALAGKLPGVPVDALIDRWVELGLLFTDAGQYVHLAVDADNQVLARIEHRLEAPDVTAVG
ncbi:RiPP maturation radical SAM C-methyltransferase [Catenuloplanes japonicus]|uniref:RiPP maturation radical SAM C-methyltransferase n=1 Tax=Catenuloplanes japonicus TaxID=33876 RepID=UPI000525814E|nr:RiPP maturation radical SAM C-methyltransferase [Catenuloplanes japonicus]